MAVKQLANVGRVVEQQNAEEPEATLEGRVTVVSVDVGGEELGSEGGETTEG